MLPSVKCMWPVCTPAVDCHWGQPFDRSPLNSISCVAEQCHCQALNGSLSFQMKATEIMKGCAKDVVRSAAARLQAEPLIVRTIQN